MLWADSPKRKESEVIFSSESRTEYLRERLWQLKEAKTTLYEEEIPFDEESFHKLIESLQSEIDSISLFRDRFGGAEFIPHAAVYTGDDYEVITATGYFCKYSDGSLWLECRSSHDYDLHLIKLTDDFEVDSEWLASLSLLDEESAEKESEEWAKAQEKESYIALERDMGLHDD